MKNLTWPHVAVIVAFLACVTALGLTGNDTAALIAVGVAILGGTGLQIGQTIAVKENTNGANRELLEANKRSAELQAANTERALTILDGNQKILASMAHKMAAMTPPENVTNLDQAKRAA